MTDRQEFKTLYDTFALDETVAPDETIRHAAPGPTLASTNLPSMELDGSATSPELELGDTIGEGGMGVVRSAKQRALVREVAVKTLRSDRSSESARNGLLNEALVTGGLEHPNVVPVYTLGQTADGAPIIVMKRIEGTPWSDVIDRGETPPGYDTDDPLGWHLDIFTQVCLAAHFAHSRDIVHRDIKPENVMIGAYGEVYLLDWGIAVTLDAEKASYLPHAADSTGLCGTPHYMAPEMTHGDATLVSPRTDVYLLGATLYHALTGRVPHDGESLFQIMYRAHESETLPLPGVHEELESIVQRAMAKAPEDRFCDVEELRQAVLDFQRHRSSIALADEARTSLDELQHLVGAGDDGREHEAAIRNLFGECRFGFHQALRLWPENPDAIDGLKTALATMIRFEISVENPGAAGALLNELDADHPKLQRRVEELEAELAERERRYRELERFQKESDLNPGARARALAAIAAAILWTIFPLFAGAVLDAGWLELTPYYYFLHGFFFSGSLLVIVWIIRDRAFRNRANRALMRLVLGVAAVVPVYRFLTWQVELDPLVGVSFECMIYAVAFIALGIMSNRFAWFGGAAFSLAGILGIQFPDYLFEVFAAANFSALVWLYYIWRPSPEDPSEREDGG